MSKSGWTRSCPSPRWSRPLRRCLVLLLTLGVAHSAIAATEEYCGKEGVWVQFLGTGGPDLADGRSASSFLVWRDQRPLLIVNPGPGAAHAMDRAGARLIDLEAILFTDVNVEHASDFAALIRGAKSIGRRELLNVFGPAGNDLAPATDVFIERLIGKSGAYPHLADMLTPESRAGFRIEVTNVPARGKRLWSKFGTENFLLASMPVHHGEFPAVAWRIIIGEQTIVFSGAAAGDKGTIQKLAKAADALILPHAVPDGTRGEMRSLYMTPTQIGKVAAAAEARMVFLANRTQRTFGRESQSREAIKASYTGPLIFAFDMECWGL